MHSREMCAHLNRKFQLPFAGLHVACFVNMQSHLTVYLRCHMLVQLAAQCFSVHDLYGISARYMQTCAGPEGYYQFS